MSVMGYGGGGRRREDTLHIAYLSPCRHTFRVDILQPPGYTWPAPRLPAGQQPSTDLTALERDIAELTIPVTVIYRPLCYRPSSLLCVIVVNVLFNMAVPAP